MPQPVIKPEDVGQIAREALILQKTARPGIEWVTDIPARGPVVPCDRRMVRQALTNLLQNAADAVSMREGAGHIGLAVTESADWVRVAVTDDGIGLPAEDRGRLTEPYVTHKPKGTGLGLAIVKKIMEDHLSHLKDFSVSQKVFSADATTGLAIFTGFIKAPPTPAVLAATLATGFVVSGKENPALLRAALGAFSKN